MAQIIWTEPALADLEAIASYIALDKPTAAKRLVQRVFARVDQLAIFPLSGGKPSGLADTPYRQLVINPLRIFYRVEVDRVFIVYVMRGEQLLRLRDLQER
ncbi:type II toxin-antitoxin system RelE/ParE family toxin [Oleiharenicola lentus]|jgi:toxin ParE1/3/4|uniref:Type II toxin-antitoxin system RelE/ParE family toxin n=1 Tax=Oleiharenicola lentus TaxID=2508720 RepID=A0A4Q1CC95_9BACT|nr:type II toxin-antitoxin system RelE/ParE family toxin [Oleiharenicola lentus]RXK56576.1 type II toxin-antitoxin system RelE/ParE family toxin [Oleiharenicola lentus]